MPILNNHAEHDFHYPEQVGSAKAKGETDEQANARYAPSDREKAITFPRRGAMKDDGTYEMADVEVTDEKLQEMLKHRIAKGWFGPQGLMVKGGYSMPEAKKKAS